MAVREHMQFQGVPGYCYQRPICVWLKCQKELLCMADLAVAAGFQKACAAEMVTQEAKATHENSQATTGQEKDISIHFKCYCCGKQGHSAVE